MQRMVDLGRDAGRALLTELARGDFYQRLLAIQSCYGSGDITIALAALTDTSHPMAARSGRSLASPTTYRPAMHRR
jgi:hypothetical protein